MASSLGSSALCTCIKHTRPDDGDSDSDTELFMINDNWPRFIALTSASEEKPLS